MYELKPMANKIDRCYYVMLILSSPCNCIEHIEHPWRAYNRTNGRGHPKRPRKGPNVTPPICFLIDYDKKLKNIISS